MIDFKLSDFFVMPFEKDWPDFRMFAIRRHAMQAYGDLPYAYHLAMVETYLAEHGFSEYCYRAAAWLHDVVEDTSTTVDAVNHHYGPEVAGMVWACTGEGSSRAQRNTSIYRKLKEYPKAAPVKVADRLANLYCANKDSKDGKGDGKLKMYFKEWPDFKKNIGPLMNEDKKSFVLWDLLCTDIEKYKEEHERSEPPASTE